MTANWTPAADQSSGVKASDLQVAKGTGTATRSFTMEHKMGLLTAAISTSTTTVDNVITYDGNSWNGTTWTSSSKTTLSYYVSRTFTSSNKPYISSNTLYYIGKPSANDITFTTSATDSGSPLYYAWTLHNGSTTTTVVGSASTYKTLTIPAYSGKTFRQKIWNYSYSGEGKQFNVPHTGNYKIECWGAGGGAGMVNAKSFTAGPGKGGYTYGEISLTESTDLFIYVGGRGGDMLYNSSTKRTYQDAPGGWNGGGLGAYDRADDDGDGAGGGATDVRLESAGSESTWNTFSSLKSRIMVAGGGGGGGYRVHHGGCGGNTTGGWAWYQESGQSKVTLTAINPGSQTSGYKFGQGQDGRNNPSQTNNTSGGGGGGYYGGQAHQNSPGVTSNSGYPAPGGSSFISGYSGCNAIKEGATSSDGGDSNHTGSPNHYSGKVFTNGVMIDGDSSMPNYSGDGNITGNSGNGYARITLTN